MLPYTEGEHTFEHVTREIKLTPQGGSRGEEQRTDRKGGKEESWIIDKSEIPSSSTRIFVIAFVLRIAGKCKRDRETHTDRPTDGE